MLLHIPSRNQGHFEPRSVHENKNPTDLRRTSNERLNQSMVCSRAARLPSASTNVLKANMLFSLKMWNLPSCVPNNSHQNPPCTPNKTLLLEPSQVSKPFINKQPFLAWYVLFDLIERYFSHFSLPFNDICSLKSVIRKRIATVCTVNTLYIIISTTIQNKSYLVLNDDFGSLPQASIFRCKRPHAR